jgi:hypothetical protein
MGNADGLQLAQDPEFQRREWRLQRIGWWALALFVVAAAAGLFGDGPLSRAHAATSDARLTIDYERFLRAGAAMRLMIVVQPSTPAPITVRLPRAYLDGLRLARITPEPAAITLLNDVAELVFANASGERLTIVVDAEPVGRGRLRGRIDTDAGSLHFWHFVYF